ncbi:MAG: hypothetical protein HY243_15170 [Proteobacteria bacterium]|nr:hypothetical protein [Pseudomonadota bacterium]
MRYLSLAVAAALLFGVVASVAAPSELGNSETNRPEGVGPTVEQFQNANVFLRAAIAESVSSSKAPPTLNDPLFAQEIRTAFDERILLGLNKNDMTDLIAVCSSPVETLKLYVFYQAGYQGAAISTQAQAEQVSRNSIRFQDEIALATRFSIACGGMMAPAVVSFWENLPVSERTEIRREGIAQTRHGMAQTYSGGVIMQSEPTKAANRKLVLDAMLQHLEAYASSMGLPERQSVVATIDETLAINVFTKDARDKLRRIRLAMTRRDCVGLCAY